MKKTILLTALAAVSFANTTFAQDEDPDKYYVRNSLYMLKLDEKAENKDYEEAFKIMNATFDTINFARNYERYNDFALKERHIDFEATPQVTQEEMDQVGKMNALEKMIDEQLRGMGLKKARSEYEYAARLLKYFEQEKTAQKLVAKWYNKPGTPEGVCNFDMDLATITELGLKGLSKEAYENAKATESLLSMAAGSTDKLLSNTYVCVNRYGYVDAKEYTAVVVAGLKMATSRLGALGGIANMGIDAVASKIKGYFVRANAYLFQLDWNADLRNKVEGEYWKDSLAMQKLLDDNSFKLKYIGKSSKHAPGALSLRNTTTLDKLIARGTLRGSDAAIAALQRDNENFRPMASLHVKDGKLIAYIGLKEGVKSGDKFNVFTAKLGKNGDVEWEQVGSIKVNKGTIWDNRAGAGEQIEGAAEDKSDKDAEDGGQNPWTEFKEKPGKKIGEGCMIRLAK